MTNNQQERSAQREAFEKWHLDKYPDRSLELDDNGNYAVGTAPILFRGWQAAQQADRELIRELVALGSDILTYGSFDAGLMDLYEEASEKFRQLAIKSQARLKGVE